MNNGAICSALVSWNHLGPRDPSTVVPAVVAHQGLCGPTIRPHGLEAEVSGRCRRVFVPGFWAINGLT